MDVVDGLAHHGAAEHDARRGGLQAAALADDLADGHADGGIDVGRLLQRITADGDHAMGQRSAEAQGMEHGDAGGDVLHQHAHIGGELAAGHLQAGHRLDELLFGSHRIEGGQRDHIHGRFVMAEEIHAGQCLRLVGLDPDEATAGTGDLQQVADAAEDLHPLLLHQAIVAGQIGFTLAAVDDQGVDGVSQRQTQLVGGGEHGAAHADDTGIGDQGDQLLALQLTQVAMQRWRDALEGLGGDPQRDGPPFTGFDGGDGGRQWRVDRHREAAIGLGQQLVGRHLVSDSHHRDGGGAGVLAQCQDQPPGGQQGADLLLVGQLFMAVRVNAAMGLDACLKHVGILRVAV